MTDIVLPSNIKKYTSSIQKCPYNADKWQVVINHKTMYHSKVLPSKEEAEQYLKDMNVTLGLPIKNKLRLLLDYVEVEFPQSKWMKIDYIDLPLIEDKIVSIAYGYATVHIDGKIA